MKLETRFRQINILFAFLLALFISTQTVRRVLYNQHAQSAVPIWTATTIIYAAFMMIFLVLVFVRERPMSRLAQILMLIGLGSAVVGYVAPKELGGDMAFLIAAALSYKYGMLNTRPVVKIGLIFGALVVARSFGFVVDDSIRLDRVVNQIVVIIVAIPVLYWVFENEFLHLKRKHTQLETAYQEDQPLMEFGRNVTGIVHDFKNDLALFDTFGQYLALSEGEPIDDSQVSRYRGYVNRLSHRIERITLVTKAAQRYEEEEGDLRTLLDSTLYVFESNLAYRREITFDVSLPENPVLVQVPPAPVVSILENLLSNSCEALMEQANLNSQRMSCKSRISVSIHRDPQGVSIRIDDTGPGLPTRRRGGSENLLYCPSIALGQTTKKHGSGIGLVSVRWHSEKHDIPVHLSNRADGGVRAWIRINPRRVISPAEFPTDIDG